MPKPQSKIPSPARSDASGRLSSVVEKFINNDNFTVSPMKRRSVLPNDTDIEAPRRASWWKRLEGSSRDVLEALDTNKMPDDLLEEEYEFEVEKDKKNQTVPESSDNESVASIVVPQRRLFNQKKQSQAKFGMDKKNQTVPESSDNESVASIVVPQRRLFNKKKQSQAKFGDIMGSRKPLGKTNIEDVSIDDAPKHLFNKGPRNRPVFPAALLNSTNKTINKTVKPETNKQARPNLFGQARTKRKNMFTDKDIELAQEENQDNTLTEENVSIDDAPKHLFNKGPRNRPVFPAALLNSTNKTINKTVKPETNKQARPNLFGQARTKRKNMFTDKDIELAQEENQDNTLTEENASLNPETEQVNKTKSIQNKSLNQTKLSISIKNDDNDKTLTNENIETEDSSRREDIKENNVSKQINKTQNYSKSARVKDKTLQNKSSKRSNNTEEVIEHIEQVRDNVTNHELIENEPSIEVMMAELQSEIIEKETSQQKSPSNTQNRENLIHTSEKDKSKQEIRSLSQDPITLDSSKESSNENQEEDMEEMVWDDNDDVIEETPNNSTHDTTGRNRKKEISQVKSPEAVLQNITKEYESFRPIGRSTTFRKSKSVTFDNMNIRTSLPPVQESTLGSEGSRNSSTEGSGWDSHRTTRKTIRQMFGKDFTPHKSLRALVMEQSAKRQTELYNKTKNKTALEDVNDKNASKMSKTKNRTVTDDVDERNALDDHHNRGRRVSNRNVSSNQLSDSKSPAHGTLTHHVSDPLISEPQASYHESLHDVNVPEISEQQISNHEESINISEISLNEDMDDTSEKDKSEEEIEPSCEDQESQESSKEESQENQEDDMDETSEKDKSEEELEPSSEEQETLDSSKEESQENLGEDMEHTSKKDKSKQEIRSLSQDPITLDSSKESSNENQEEDMEEMVWDDNDDVIEETPNNSTHDTTGRNRKKEISQVKSPEAVLQNITKEYESFRPIGRSTTIRKSKSVTFDNMNIRTSLPPVQESTLGSEGSRNSSTEGSGWDSHRTTRKTIRQMFGKDFTPHKSLRALVMEQSAKRQTELYNKTKNKTALEDVNDKNASKMSKTKNRTVTDDVDERNALDDHHNRGRRVSNRNVSSNQLSDSKSPAHGTLTHHVSDPLISEPQASYHESLHDVNAEQDGSVHEISEHSSIQEEKEDSEPEESENEVEQEESENEEELIEEESQQEEPEFEQEESQQEEPESEQEESQQEIDAESEQESENEDHNMSHKSVNDISQHESEQESAHNNSEEPDIESDQDENDEEVSENFVSQVNSPSQMSNSNRTERVVFDSEMSDQEIDYELSERVSRQITVNDISEQVSEREPTPELTRSRVSEPRTHDVSVGTKKSMRLQLDKIAQQNMEIRQKIREKLQNSLKPTGNFNMGGDILPIQYKFSIRRPNKSEPKKPVTKRPKPTGVPAAALPKDFMEDLLYKPPKRFQPTNAPWITKRLYKFLETKLEPKYDYRARVRAEELVQTLHSFAKLVRRHHVAPPDAVDELKREMARLHIVNTHHEFYDFFHEFMPREVRIKVNPDVVNKIPMPRNGVFSEILQTRSTVE